MVKRSGTIPRKFRFTPELDEALTKRVQEEMVKQGARNTYGLESEVVEEILRREFGLPPKGEPTSK